MDGDELTTLADTYTIESGATLATVPDVDGKTAAGWNTEADGTGTAYASGVAIVAGAYGDLDLYAQYDDNAYTLTVRFEEADGSIADDTITVEGLKYNEKYSFEVPVVVGQLPTIKGAYVTAGEDYEVTVTGDATVLVKYVDEVALEVDDNFTDAANGKHAFSFDPNKNTVKVAGDTVTITMSLDNGNPWRIGRTVNYTVEGAKLAGGATTGSATGLTSSKATFTIALTDITGSVTITIKD